MKRLKDIYSEFVKTLQPGEFERRKEFLKKFIIPTDKSFTENLLKKIPNPKNTLSHYLSGDLKFGMLIDSSILYLLPYNRPVRGIKANLKESINEHKLIMPLIIGPDGAVLDGQHRDVECFLQNIVIIFFMLDKAIPKDYPIITNVLNVGQKNRSLADSFFMNLSNPEKENYKNMLNFIKKHTILTSNGIPSIDTALWITSAINPDTKKKYRNIGNQESQRSYYGKHKIQAVKGNLIFNSDLYQCYDSIAVEMNELIKIIEKKCEISDPIMVKKAILFLIFNPLYNYDLAKERLSKSNPKGWINKKIREMYEELVKIVFK